MELEESMRQLMGNHYKEGLTTDEIQTFFKNQVLGSGDYENKEKANADRRKLESQVADLKKQLSNKMTEDEKKQESDAETRRLIEDLQKQLAESKSTISKKTAISYLSGVKIKAGIKDDDKEFEDFISSIAFEDNDKTDKVSQYISKIVSSAYETGKNEAVKNKLGKMGSFKEGQENSGVEEKGAYGKQLAQVTKNDATIKKDFFERK